MRRSLISLVAAGLALLVPAVASAAPSVKITRLPRLPAGLSIAPAATSATVVVVVERPVGGPQTAYRLVGRRWRRIGRVLTDQILVGRHAACVGAFVSSNSGRTFSRLLPCPISRPDPSVAATVVHGGTGYRARTDLNAVLVTEPGQSGILDDPLAVQFHATPPAFAWTDRTSIAGLAVSGVPAEIAFGEAISGDGLIVHRTIDEGATWLAGAKLAHGFRFLPDATVARRLYGFTTSTAGVGVARSDDDGTTWRPTTVFPKSVIAPFDVDVDAVRPGRVTVALAGGRLFASNDGAVTFRAFPRLPGELIRTGTGRYGDWFLVRGGGREIRRVLLRG